MELIQLIFKYEYMQNAYIVGVLLGFLAPIIGVYIVIRRLSLIVDAISHISLAGLSFGMMIGKVYGVGIEPVYIGSIFAVFGSLLIEKIRSIYKNYKEISIPIIMSFSVALSVIFASIAEGFNKDLLSYLFGSILTVTRTDVYMVLIITLFVIIVIRKYYFVLMSVSIDENYAKFIGIPVKVIKVLFTVLIAIIISMSIKIIGMMLISALIVVPVSSAMKIAENFKYTLIYSIIFSEISVILGLITSYYLDIPSGATIVIFNIIIFTIINILKRSE